MNNNKANTCNKNHDSKIINYSIYIFCFCSFFFISYITLSFQISFKEFFISLINNLYFASANICPPGKIQSINIIILLYTFLIFIIISIFILKRILQKSKNIFQSHTLRIATNTILMTLITISLMQQLSRFNKMKKEFIYFQDPKNFYNELISFSTECKKRWPGRHSGKILTDKDLSKDPQAFIHRALSYFLYPNICTRFKNNAPNDCIILFYMQDVKKSVPQGYKILFTDKSGQYTFAVKKN